MSLLSIDSYDKQLETQKILAEFTSESMIDEYDANVDLFNGNTLLYISR